MRIIELHSNWKMRVYGEAKEEYLPATVPGSVYGDLLNNGKMEDPFYRDNEMKALALIEKDYEYVTNFEPNQELLDSDQVLLRFEGVDTMSSIYLNGVKIGIPIEDQYSTNNMHRIWEFSVKDILKTGENELRVILHSPTRYIAESYKKNPIKGSTDAMQGFSRIRKAHCMFGWDWGPRLPDAGIWRKVLLLGIQTARIDSVYIVQKHEEDRVTLELETIVEMYEAEGKRKGFVGGNLSYRVAITDPFHKTSQYKDNPEVIIIENPLLWWPNGYGEQYLYGIKVELLQEDKVLDTWEKRIGLRTLSISMEADKPDMNADTDVKADKSRNTADGQEFAHIINGIKIFAMGADYIPEDNLLCRVSPERTYHLLQQAKDVHFNVIRIWGGGYYPDDFFYDACDELGLIVWQDFMFACAVYDLTPEFEETIIAEFVDNIKRLRHHASLGLWCGNNEMEVFLKDNAVGWCTRPGQISDYVKIFEYIIPKVVKQYDPQTFYWPSSPSSGGAFDEPNDENRGDVHYWDVWHGGKPFTEYRKFRFRYVSEFGFQSFPSLKTVETFTEEEDRNIFSYIMEKHQRNGSANGIIMRYMEQTYLYPTDFDITLYASQLLQAEAIRYGVEHFRRYRGRCMGTIIWQLNDCWPVASWASIDYYGRWKALHYYAKRFFAPLMVSCCEESTLTQDPNVNAEPYELQKSFRLCVCNETLREHHVVVRWALRDTSASVIRQGEWKVTVPKLSSHWVEKIDLPEADIFSQYVSYEMEEAGAVVSSGTVLFCAPKYFRFHNPELRVEVEGDLLKISAMAFAKSVEVINEADDLLLSDNYFDMNGGTKTIRIQKGLPEGLKIRSVYDIR